MDTSRVIRYCKVCQNNVNDKTKGNNKLVCDNPMCKKAYYKVYMKGYNDAYRKLHKKEYLERLGKMRLKNSKYLPLWACQRCGHRVLLTFDPIRFKNNQKLLGLVCPACKQKATE